MLNDIPLRLTGIKYLKLIDISSGYYNVKLNEKSTYLTTFLCPFDRYQNIKLPFGAVLADDLFKKKIEKLFSDIHNVSGIAYDILIAGFDADGKDYKV